MQPKDKTTYYEPEDEYNKNFKYEVIWVDEILIVDELPKDPKAGVVYRLNDETPYIWSGTEWMKIGGDVIIQVKSMSIDGDTLIVEGEQ